jgi:hypothetical protein
VKLNARAAIFHSKISRVFKSQKYASTTKNFNSIQKTHFSLFIHYCAKRVPLLRSSSSFSSSSETRRGSRTRPVLPPALDHLEIAFAPGKKNESESVCSKLKR